MKNIFLDLAKIKNRKIVCMTLDLEQDYGDLLNMPSYEGLSQIKPLLSLFKKHNLPLTCFTQGSLFQTHPQAIEQFNALDTEFGVHTFGHPKPQTIDHGYEIRKGKEAFIKYFHKEPMGYRSAAGVVSESMFKSVTENSFKYDSSVFPSFRPGGYYNSLHMSLIPHLLNGGPTLEFPVTVFPKVFRVPISLSYIKLLGKPYLNLIKICRLPDLIVFDFHLHDLKTLDSAKNIPQNKYSPLYRAIFKKIYQNNYGLAEGMVLLDSLISIFSNKGYEFLKLADVYEILTETRII